LEGRGSIRAVAPIVFAASLFLLLAAVVGFRKPGLQYDEALFEHGTVQMLTSGGVPPFAHEPGSWVRIGDRFWPLMVLPYIGAAEHYVLLPVFGSSGQPPAAGRVVGASIGALGLLGIGLALAKAISPGAAAAVVLILAIHPGLLLTVLYDNTGFALWMGCMGLTAIGLERYTRRLDGGSAFLLGVAAGAGVWCRANFIWLVVPLALSFLIVYGRNGVPSGRNGAFLAVGGILGSLPLIVYEALSRFGTLRFMRTRGTPGPVDGIGHRLLLFSESLLCDPNRRSIWGAWTVPVWQTVFVTAVLVVASILAMSPGRRSPSPGCRVGRVAVLTLAGYLAFVLTSTLKIGPHHLINIVPVAAIAVALAFSRFSQRLPAKIAIAATASLYGILAGGQIVEAARSVRATGGVGQWSDAIERVADVLQHDYPRRDVYLLSWGFANNLFVLSDGMIASVEVSLRNPVDTTSGSPSPPMEPDPAAVYVFRRWGPEDGPGSELARFLGRLSSADPPFRRTRILQRNGDPYADVYGIPGREPSLPRIGTIEPPKVVAGVGFNVQPSGDSAIEIRGSGFRPTDEAWWDSRPLATTFGGPGLITALVPNRLFDHPGTVRITIRHGETPEPGAEAKLPILAAGR